MAIRQTDSGMESATRLRGSARLQWMNAALLVAVLAGCTDAHEESAQVQRLTAAAGGASCPVKQIGAAGEQDVAQWSAWTTSRCVANYAAAVIGDGSDAQESVVCAYYDPASLTDTSVQRTCRSGDALTHTTLTGDAHACYDNGDCLVEFMSVQPVATDGNEWLFRLGAAAAPSAGRMDEVVHVGELVVPSRVSRLTFDGRQHGQDAATNTTARFVTDLSAANSLQSLLFIGLDVSASALPRLPPSLRELHIVDCVLRDLPLLEISQLQQLEKLVLRRNVLQDASSSVLTLEQFAFLQARLSEDAREDQESESTTADRRQETLCPDGSGKMQLGGVQVCVDGSSSVVMAIERRQLLTNSSSTSSLRNNNNNSSSSDEDGTTKSIYIIASFAGPGLYFLYKLGLYLYFYSTYSKHQKSVHTPVVVNKSSVQPGDDDSEARTTEKVSSSSSPDSLEFAAPPPSLVLPPPPADQRRFNNMSFWVDEELQDWRMDFNQVKMLKCLTTTPNQKRHLRLPSDPNVLSVCELWLGTFYPQGAPDAEQRVALKWLPPKHKEPQSPALDKFKGEIKRQAQFSHPNVVKFFGIVWSVDTHLVAVTEFMARGDLRQWLHRYAVREAGRWSVQKVQILLDVAKALLYLHSMRPALVHGNCNSRNVLLNERMKAKLSDFGSSKDLLSERELMAYSAVGSGRWISPEALVGRESKAASQYGGAVDAAAAADVYSLGILMSEMDTHELPFSDLMQANKAALPETDVLQLIAKGALSPTLSPTCHPRIGELIECCTAFSPKNRPSSREVVHALQQIVQELKSEAAGDSGDSDDDGDYHLLAQSKGVVV